MLNVLIFLNNISLLFLINEKYIFINKNNDDDKNMKKI